MSRIRGIAIRNRPRAAMQSIDSAQLSGHSGILGDYRGTQQDRQVTLLSETAWNAACAEVEADPPWTTRRANLLLDEVEFGPSHVGQRLRIGAVELEITRETVPCSMMDAQCPGLTAALRPHWRGGVCCKVLQPGHIRLGDQVEFD